jgi:hypothetical protein
MRLTFLLGFAVVSFIPLTARSQAQTPPNGPGTRASMAQFVQPPEPRPLNQGEMLPAPEPGPRQAAGLTVLVHRFYVLHLGGLSRQGNHPIG